GCVSSTRKQSVELLSTHSVGKKAFKKLLTAERAESNAEAAGKHYSPARVTHLSCSRRSLIISLRTLRLKALQLE
ncbi:MAG: hypothetical protein DMG92_03005, partial [Acidobacteria bacterium]